MAELHILSGAKEAATAVADYITILSRKCVMDRGRFTVALSGGSTPRGLYGKLAQPEYAGRISWGAWQVFWSDERCVPPDHKDSNYRLAKEALLDHILVSTGQMHRMRGEEVPHQAAQEYEALVRQVLGAAAPSFDLILLGMGEDGHTASLFPGSVALEERDLLVVAAPGPAGGREDRLSFSLPLINGAREVAFLVNDESKAEALRRVHHPDPGAAPSPAALVRPASGRVHWFLTRAAAMRLEGTKV